MVFYVFMAMNIKITVFLDMTPCSLKNRNILDHHFDPIFTIEKRSFLILFSQLVFVCHLMFFQEIYPKMFYGLFLSTSKLHAHNIVCSSISLFWQHENNEVKKNEMGRACGTHKERSNTFRILVGKLEWKKPLGRLRRKWEDNIKIDFREIGFGGMDWIHLGRDRDQWRALVNTMVNIMAP
jgi:hypothetical protein